MKELSLNILDIAQNSVKARAENILIELIEADGKLSLTIKDDGCGMSEETVQNVMNPFYTTRTTRNVGLGIPLLKLAAEQTGGGIKIESVSEIDNPRNHGTTVTAEFFTDHIDCTPLGDIISTVTVLIQGSPDIEWRFEHHFENGKVELDKDVFVQGMIKSTINVTGTLKIYEKGEVVIQKSIPVRKGDNKFNYSYTPDGPGLHTITATFEVNGDTVEQNNMCCSWYTVEDIQRILLLYGNGQKNQLAKFISTNFTGSEEYAIETLDVSSSEYSLKDKFPKTMEELLFQT